jgi:microcystin-dependent protein
MARVRAKARILERTITAGNGPYALAGAVDGSYNRFASIMAIGDTAFATVTEPGVAFWAGIVTYSATNEITLTTVEESKGTFGAGTKEVYAGKPASRDMFEEDIAGAIITGGTSTAYTVASYRKYATLAAMDGAIIAFSPHVNSGATVTLSVDGLAAAPLRPSPGVELQSNVLLAGSPYFAVYRAGVFYLHALGGNTYGIPLGAGMDYWAPTAPSSAFAFAQGQALSTTTYSALFALFGYTYGGAGATFNIPDKVGRVSAMLDGGSARISPSYFGGNPANLGAVGGSESATLTLSQIPTGITSPVSVTSPLSNFLTAPVTGYGITAFSANAGAQVWQAFSNGASIVVAGSITSTGSGTSNNTGGLPHRTVQPTIVCNYIIRVL